MCFYESSQFYEAFSHAFGCVFGEKTGPASNFHAHVINLDSLGKLLETLIFSGRFGPQGGRTRIFVERSLPKVGSRLESVSWGPVSWPFSVFAKFATSITT